MGTAYLHADIGGKDSTLSASLKVEVTKNYNYPTSVNVASYTEIVYDETISTYYVPFTLNPTDADVECVKPLNEYGPGKAFFAVTVDAANMRLAIVPVNNFLGLEGDINFYCMKDPTDTHYEPSQEDIIGSCKIKFVEKAK